MTDDADPTPSDLPGGERSAPAVGVVCVFQTGGDVMSDDQKFRDKAERQIFATTMEARIRQCPFEAADEVASRAWAMVLEYRSRCPANNRGPTGEAVAEAWGWLEASAGWQWASADEAANDAGPTHADLRGEVNHGD